MSDDFDEAYRLATELEGLNDQRRAIEAELSEIAKVQAAEIYHGQRALVVAGEGWHEGVKGIVGEPPGRHLRRAVHPFDHRRRRGARLGRSVGRVNLFAAVESASDLLVRFGGHEAAVGITLQDQGHPRVYEGALRVYSTRCPRTTSTRSSRSDACINLDELTLETVGALKQVAPFGQENPTPCFLARDVLLTHCRAVGTEKNHFSCTLTNGRTSISGIMFHCTDIDMLMATDSVVNAAFQVENRHLARAQVGEGDAAVRYACSHVSCARGVPRAGEPVVRGRPVRHERCGALRGSRCESPEDIEAYEAEREKNRALWEQKAQSDPDALEDAVVRAIIGDRELHKSQRVVLSSLRAGQLRARRHGDGARQVAHLPGACGMRGACAP